MSKEREINMAKIYPNSNYIRIISLNHSKNNILIGTRGGEVIELQEKNMQANVLMEGHYDEELWGLSVMNGKR